MNETNSDAEQVCRKALADAGFAYGSPTSFHWSQLANPAGEKLAAINAYHSLLDKEKCSKSALEGLAYLYQLMGHQDHAKYFRKKLKEVEVHEYDIDESSFASVVDYLLAKTGEAKMPDHVPLDYVSVHFDNYSEIFDSSLTGDLAYVGPELIHEQVNLIFSSDEARNLQILDIGCGTGLVGKLLAPFAVLLVGVDLSEKMLEKANERNVYHKLIKKDCLSFLGDNTAQFDLIAASDVLNYFGGLKELFEMVHKNLNPNGVFIFTIEQANITDFRLSNTGRYQHSSHYIRQIAKENNFQNIYESKVDLRKERNKMIDAMLFCLKK